MSFSGAQRVQVEKVVRACQRLGVTVFYDRDHIVDFWGQDVITALREIYSGARARYMVPFLSTDYLASAYPMDELRAALVPSIASFDGYILPIFIGAVDVPAELLRPSIGYLRFEDYTIDQLAQSIAARVGVAPKRNRFPSAAPGSSSRTVRATRSSIKPELLDPPMARPSRRPPPDYFLTADVGNDLPSSDADARRRAERKRDDDQRGS